MEKQEAKAEGALKLSGGVRKYTVKRGYNTLSFLVAIYATALTVVLSTISFLPLCDHWKIGLIAIAVPFLYWFTFSTQIGRKLLSKELARLLEFEERYGSK